MANTFKVKQPDGSIKRYESETEIYPDQAYENYVADGGEMTYVEFCADRFIEVKPKTYTEQQVKEISRMNHLTYPDIIKPFTINQGFLKQVLEAKELKKAGFECLYMFGGQPHWKPYHKLT